MEIHYSILCCMTFVFSFSGCCFKTGVDVLHPCDSDTDMENTRSILWHMTFVVSVGVILCDVATSVMRDCGFVLMMGLGFGMGL